MHAKKKRKTAEQLFMDIQHMHHKMSITDGDSLKELNVQVK